MVFYCIAGHEAAIAFLKLLVVNNVLMESILIILTQNDVDHSASSPLKR